MKRCLADLGQGLKVKIKEINLPKDLRDKLYELGLIPGQEIEILQDAPLGGPIKIRVGDYCLALRRKEAKGIVVEEPDGKGY
ncbi:MAG: ferrous iron transport protein A [Hydrogenothermaceae bacterium]|nr:ferrous iron transport protein A [Hydrogenothermaceae bacterium]